MISCYWIIVFVVGIVVVANNFTPVTASLDPGSSQVPTCCNFLQDTSSLSSCIDSATRNLGETANSNLGIVTFSTSDIMEYSVYSHAVNAIYAEHNQYSIQFIDPLRFPEYDIPDKRWTKVKLLLDGLSNISVSWSNTIEFLVWIDSDAIFLDMNLNLEDFFVRHPKVQIVVSAESAGSRTMINTGTILIRKSKWTESFLREWWGTEADRKHLSDQERFDKVFHMRKHASSGPGTLDTATTSNGDDNGHNNGDDNSSGSIDTEGISVADAVLILPPDGLNSDPPAKFHQLPHNPVLHLMGESISYRAHVFKTALTNLCASLRGSNCTSSSGSQAAASAEVQSEGICFNDEMDFNHVPEQLGITQEKLMAWSLDIYSKLYDHEYETYYEKSFIGNNSLAECMSLANVAKHYTDTLSMMETLVHATGEPHDGEIPGERIQDVINVRKLVYDAIYVNFEAQKENYYQYRTATGKVLPYWPEMIRNLVSVAQPLMEASQGMSISEKLSVAKVCLDLLYELHDMVNVEQQAAIYYMVALHYKIMGLIYLDGGDFTSALTSLELSVNMLKELIDSSGQHVISSALTALGTAYAAVERFDDALDMFKEAANIVESHLGPWHDMVMEIKLNHAVTAHVAGKIDISEQSATEALKILNRNNRRQNFDHLRTAESILDMIAKVRKKEDHKEDGHDGARENRAEFL